jgi:hypothetical protein
MEQEAVIRELQVELMRATEELTTYKETETIGRTLFECLMNRIYNVSDFERLGAISERERQAVDAWLQRTERDSNAG